MADQKIILKQYVIFKGKNRWECRLCQLESSGHRNRMIAHLTRTPGKGIKICPKISPKVMEELKRELGIGPMYPSPFPHRLKRPGISGVPSFHAIRVSDMGITSPLMRLHGGVGYQGTPSLNIQGFVVAPWKQPRLDASLSGLQPEAYQAMAAPALHETIGMDSFKSAYQSVLQLQQSQNASVGNSSFQRQIFPPQSQITFIHSSQANQLPFPAQLLQQQPQRQTIYSEQQQQQQVNQISVQQQIPSIVSTLYSETSRFEPASLQAISQQQQQSFSDGIGNTVAISDVSCLSSVLGSLPQNAAESPNAHGSNSVISSSSMLPKQRAVDLHLSSEASQCVQSNIKQLATPHSNVSGLANLLPPFTGREYFSHQIADPHNSLLFGTNIDSSPLMLQNEIQQWRNISSENYSSSASFAASRFANAATTGFTSSCIDELRFLQFSKNFDQVILSTLSFLDVHKFGFVNTSLEISKLVWLDVLTIDWKSLNIVLDMKAATRSKYQPMATEETGGTISVSEENIWSLQNLEKCVGPTIFQLDDSEQNFPSSVSDLIASPPGTLDALMTVPPDKCNLLRHDQEWAYVPNTNNNGFQETNAVGSDLINTIHQGQSSSLDSTHVSFLQGSMDLGMGFPILSPQVSFNYMNDQQMHPLQDGAGFCTSSLENAFGFEMAMRPDSDGPLLSPPVFDADLWEFCLGIDN